MKVVLFVNAQDSTLNFKDLYKDADYYFLFEDYTQALPIYEELYQSDTTNANVSYHIGLCYLYLLSKEENIKAIPYLEKSILKIAKKRYREGSFKEDRAPVDAYYYLANAYRIVHEFDKAIATYEKYLEETNSKNNYYLDFVKREIADCKTAKELISLPINLESEQIRGELTATSSIESCPVVSNDGKRMVFALGKNNIFPPDFIAFDADNADYVMDDIYYSEKIQGKWSEPQNIMKDLMATNKTVPVSISYSGKKLYLVRDDFDDGNIYVSMFNESEGKWGIMQPLNSKVNSNKWESHACIAPGDSILYFTSERRGGYGGLDIYMSKRDEKGRWGKPINLGDKINTSYDEETPTILEDGRTMFFSSQGHYGMGGFDIFCTVKSGDADTSWSEPLNIGYSINTIGNDLVYIPKNEDTYAFAPLNTNDARMFYFDSDRDLNDVYQVKTNPADEFIPYFEIAGSIRFSDTDSIKPYSFTVFNITKNDTVRNITQRKKSGEYSFIVSEGKYLLKYSSEGYSDYEYEVFLPKIYTPEKLIVNVTMFPESQNRDALCEVIHEYQMDNEDLMAFRKAVTKKAKKVVVLEGPQGEELIVDLNKSETVIEGVIYNSDNQSPGKSRVIATDAETGEILGAYETDETGKYMMVLPSDTKVNIYAESDDYLYHSENVFIDKESAYSKNEEVSSVDDIILKKDYQSYSLDFNDSSIENYRLQVNRLADFLVNNKDYNLQVLSSVPSGVNTRIFKRIDEVCNFIMSSGVDSSRIARSFIKDAEDNHIEFLVYNRQVESSVIAALSERKEKPPVDSVKVDSTMLQKDELLSENIEEELDNEKQEEQVQSDENQNSDITEESDDEEEKVEVEDANDETITVDEGKEKETDQSKLNKEEKIENETQTDREPKDSRIENLATEDEKQIKNVNGEEEEQESKHEYEVEGVVVVSDILFEFDRYITEEYYKNLDVLAEYLKNNPEVELELAGYADEQGSADYNIKLTERRALFVKDYLMNKGVEGDRLKTKGYGKTNLISIGLNPGTRKYNRRVEFKILKKGKQELIIKRIVVPEEYQTNMYNFDLANAYLSAKDIIAIRNLLFGFDKHTTDEYNKSLNRLADYLVNNRQAKIEVGAHTDAQGDEVYNLMLSKKRAKFVKNYLNKKGVDNNAVDTKGYGETQLITIDLNPRTRKYNRRVEFKIIRQGDKQTLKVVPIVIPEEYLIKKN